MLQINIWCSKSAMGPGRDLEENASARIRNIETFEVGFKLFTINIMIVITIVAMIKIMDRKLSANSWQATITFATRTSSPSTSTTTRMRLRLLIVNFIVNCQFYHRSHHGHFPSTQRWGWGSFGSFVIVMVIMGICHSLIITCIIITIEMLRRRRRVHDPWQVAWETESTLKSINLSSP